MGDKMQIRLKRREVLALLYIHLHYVEAAKKHKKQLKLGLVCHYNKIVG